MSQKKITIISPKFHPLEDGLGQYTKWFYLALKKHAELSVITSTDNKITPSEVEFSKIFSHIKNWHFSGLFKIDSTLKEINPDVVLFQYVPFMYAPRGGINFSIVFYMLYLRLFTRKEIQIMCHELHYPCHFNLKALIMFFSHITMLYIAGISAHKVFCSAGFFRDRVRKMFLGLKKNVFHLPVGSNIIEHKISQEEVNSLRSKIIEKDEILLGCFGSFHPSKNYPLIIQTLLNVKEKSEIKIKLLFIGASKESILAELPVDLREACSEFICGTGFLSQKDVAKNIQILDGFIGYFSDGVSTRRGSLIAALQYGIPVLTTKTLRTEELFSKVPSICLIDANEEIFQRELENRLISNWPIGFESSQDIEEVYAQYFSWDSIIKKYIDLTN